MAEERPDQCHACQIKNGATEPKWGLNGVTCRIGDCPGCGDKNVVLMYACDYDWPDQKAIWD